MGDWDLLTRLGVHLPDDFDARIQTLYKLVLDANQTHNLTTITGPQEFMVKHVVDSLLAAAACPALQSQELTLADIGCGGGFPALPLALAFSNLQLTAIDSTRKKVECVQSFFAALGIAGTGVHGRARELGRQPEYRGRYQVLTARAVARTPVLLKECKGLLAPDGLIIAYKTPDQLETERGAVERDAPRHGLSAETSDIYELPGDCGSRQFWILRKS